MRHPDGRPWTQKDVADIVGASLRSYASWERGDATPQAHFNIKLDELFADQPASVTPPIDEANPLSAYTVSELLSEALTRVVRQEARAAQRSIGAESRPPEKVQWMPEDAPSAVRERREAAERGDQQGGNQAL